MQITHQPSPVVWVSRFGTLGRDVKNLLMDRLPTRKGCEQLIGRQMLQVRRERMRHRPANRDVAMSRIAHAVKVLEQKTLQRMIVARPIHLAGFYQLNITGSQTHLIGLGQPDRKMAFG